MWNDASNYKKLIYTLSFGFILIIFLLNFPNKTNTIAFAEVEQDLENEFNKNIEDILGEIDTDGFDDYLVNDFNLKFLDVKDFKDLIVKVLNGTYFDEYDSLFDGVVSLLKNNVKDLVDIFVIFLFLVLLYELFKSFCIDKYIDLKNVIRLVFSVIISFLIFQIFQDLILSLSGVIEKIFSFAKILFPILLNLILLSGASGSYSVYSSLSLFLINSGSYIFVYFLIPVSISIFSLTLFGSIFSSKKFSKIIDIFKSIFKYTLIIFFTIFGLFSSINMISSGVKDGVGLRLTKYAIKNYIPIIGGYVSQGFDFIHSCSIVIKNAFGICSVVVLIFVVLKPLILYFAYLLLFKLLSAATALVGDHNFSDLFNNVSKTLSYFITIIAGLFFIIFVFIYLLIVSVSVV